MRSVSSETDPPVANSSTDTCQKEKLQWCELCKLPARVFCEADEASLCWQCDAQVHGANFLVARHLRTLLCHTCGSPTLWMKTGFRIDPKVPFCQHCFHETNCGGKFDRDDEESRIVPSASSAMSYFSPGTVQQYCFLEGRTKHLHEIGEDDSKIQRSNSSPCSDRVQPLQLSKKKNAAELTRQVETCCKEWMPVASSGDEADVGTICKKLSQKVSSNRGQSQQPRTSKKIRTVVQRVLDGYDTEESASSVNTSVRRSRRKCM